MSTCYRVQRREAFGWNTAKHTGPKNQWLDRGNEPLWITEGNNVCLQHVKCLENNAHYGEERLVAREGSQYITELRLGSKHNKVTTKPATRHD